MCVYDMLLTCHGDCHQKFILEINAMGTVVRAKSLPRNTMHRQHGHQVQSIAHLAGNARHGKVNQLRWRMPDETTSRYFQS